MDNKTVGYAKRAWNDLTSDKRWWKVILALGLLNCLPIIGQVMTAGYLYDWAKEGAWNMKRPLPHELGDVARRCKYGLYWLVCAVVWGLPCYIVGLLLALIPVIGGLLQVVCNVVCIIALVLSSVGALRSAIYERAYPGLQVIKVMRMAEHDLLGLCRAFCILLLAVVVLAIALLLILIPALPLANMIEASGAELLHGTGLITLIALGLTCVVVGLIVWIAATVCITLVFALYVRCIGYWTAQFEPVSWGAPGEAMPFEVKRKKAGPVRPPRASGEEAAQGAAEPSAIDKLLVPLAGVGDSAADAVEERAGAQEKTAADEIAPDDVEVQKTAEDESTPEDGGPDCTTAEAAAENPDPDEQSEEGAPTQEGDDAAPQPPAGAAEDGKNS